MYAVPGIFEVEKGGSTYLKATQIDGIDFEREIAKFRDASGKQHALLGGKNLVDFELHCRDTDEFVAFWTWYNSDDPEEVDFAIHRKSRNKQILNTLEFEEVIPRGGSMDGLNTETTTDVHKHVYKLTGRLVDINAG